jgi:uncharacterized protein YndB with AHSA1/START domain
MNGNDDRTQVERKSDREMTVTRTFNGPARIVYEAWSNPEIFRQWWTPKSFGMTIHSCEIDMRTGGTYRLVISHPSMGEPMAFFGKYLDVVPRSRIVWTNDEGDEEGAVTTVTFEDRGAETVVVLSELYPSKEALDTAIAQGSISGYPEQFAQLGELLTTLGAGAG